LAEVTEDRPEFSRPPPAPTAVAASAFTGTPAPDWIFGSNVFFVANDVDLKHHHCDGSVLYGKVSDLYLTGRRFNTQPGPTASNLEQFDNLLCTQTNSASSPQWD